MKKKIKNVSYQGIRKVEDDYGLVLFRCGLTHLIDVGHKHLQDKEFIKETCDKIQKETSPNAIMTADFQCELVKCAEELAQFPIWDLIAYIKTDVVVG